MQNILKKFMIFILTFGLLLSATNNSIVYAETSQVEQAVNDLNNPTDEAYATLATIMSYMAWIGFAIAIFKIIQIGIMFMTGTASKRSNASASLMPWVVGCLICTLFGVLGPWFISLFESGNDIFATIFIF